MFDLFLYRNEGSADLYDLVVLNVDIENLKQGNLDFLLADHALRLRDLVVFLIQLIACCVSSFGYVRKGRRGVSVARTVPLTTKASSLSLQIANFRALMGRALGREKLRKERSPL